MLFFLTLTQSCNLKCTYCGSDTNEDIEDFVAPHPVDIVYPLDRLKNLAKDPELVICFYGGEPLMKIDVMEEVIFKILPDAKFCLQTNATLLDRVSPRILEKLSTILVSIDGDAARTDACRGIGTTRRVLRNVQKARENGYKGEIVARMTVADGSDIFKDVSYLLDCGLFDTVYWQLDVLWDSPKFARWGDFLGWRDESYLPGLTRLAERFLESMEEEHRILGIVPFIGLMGMIMSGKKAERVLCGSGAWAFNVTTGGIVTACPIAPDEQVVSPLSEDFDPESVRDSSIIGGKCLSCEVVDQCGGRCLYANKTRWWDEDGFDEVCVTIKHLIRLVQEKLIPAARKLIEEGVFTLEDFIYPKYTNSLEIIP
jgi:uncharacterized protein